MSSHGHGILRATRRAAEIVLGPDGRISAAGPAPAPEPRPEDEAEAREAVGVVARAQHRAAAVIADAEAQAAAVQHDAYTEGRRRGYADGVAEARAELAGALSLVQRAAGEAKAMHDRLLWSAEHDVIELVIEATRAIVGDLAAGDPTLVVDTVERALARAGAQNVVRVRVHPDDIEQLTISLHERRGDVLPFQVLGDQAIAIGGCVLDTESGEVDARLDVQLDEIAKVLRAAVPAFDDAEVRRAA